MDDARKAQQAAYVAERYRADPEFRARRLERARSYGKTPQGRRVTYESQLRSLYGIDLEDWARMFEAQHGRCAVCPTVLGFDKRTHVDHDHVTGKVRGLLCHACNVTLGNVKDSVETLRSMIAYLERA